MHFYAKHSNKKIWTRIGAAWPNKSGKGFNLTWDYLPLGDGVTVMLPYDKEGGEVSHIPSDSYEITDSE